MTHSHVNESHPVFFVLRLPLASTKLAFAKLKRRKDKVVDRRTKFSCPDSCNRLAQSNQQDISESGSLWLGVGKGNWASEEEPGNQLQSD